MIDGDPNPLKKLEEQTANQTDFGAYVKYLAIEGIQIILDTADPSKSEEERARRTKLLIGFTTAKVLDNRKRIGLTNEVDDLWGDQWIASVIEEFIVDYKVKLLMAQGIVRGFEVAGLIPPNWRDDLDTSEIPE